VLQNRHHLFGTWAVARNNDIYTGLVANLTEAQKDLLWKLLEETVDQTIGHMLCSSNTSSARCT
jgi:hypothetical protein